MRKVFICLLATLFLLTGCSNVERQIDEEKYNAYISYYQSILEQDNKGASSSYFDIDVVVNQIDYYYRYDIFIENPRVAMFNIVALAVVDGLSLEVDTENMMPSIGILDDFNYCMVPGQIDVANKYVSGLHLTLYAEDAELSISVMVAWKNIDETNELRDYVSVYAAFKNPEEIVEDSGE